MMNMQAGIPKAQLMAGDAMNRALTRMAHEMMEQLMPLENVVLVGIRRRGVPLAQRLSDIIEKYEHVRIPVGEVDIAMYRDDRDPAQLNVEVQEKHLPVDVTGKVVVLVDDVLHTAFKGGGDKNTDVWDVIVGQDHIGAAPHHDKILFFCHIADQIALVKEHCVPLGQTMIAAELPYPFF